ncbi:MAG: SBBP repeat-containing protein, partial [Phycisphaerae bacterium]|nr:SBBP repeat-containing protein [Phycisphaerae bacterium]
DPLGSDRFDPEQYETERFQFSASFVGANLVTPVGLEQSEACFNYFVGDQADWHSEVPAYEVVAYEGLYEGIDLYTWGQRDSLKYEFHVAPGADYTQIQVTYDGIAGLAPAEDGSLLVDLGEGWGGLTDDAPVIYQEVDGENVEVAGRFVLVDDWTYSFDITGAYDPSRALVIDPDLAWATYLGGSAYDDGYDIAVDASGCALVTGRTSSSNFTGGSNNGGTNNSFKEGSYDAFVAKVSSSGSLLWATYLGGSSSDYGYGIAVDASGSALVTGGTSSSNFTGGSNNGGTNNSFKGSYDAFVAKVSSSGSLLWATYLGGSSYDYGRGIAVDASGCALVTGYTFSSNFTGGSNNGGTNNSFKGGSCDAFVAKVGVADAGDTLATAANLGTLVAGSPVVPGDQVGNGPYGTKDVDLYTFTLASSGTVTLDVDAQAIGSGLDAYLRLLNASGQEIAKNDDTHGLDPYLTLTLAAGTYYVGVSGYANRYYNPGSAGSGIAGSTGPYTLTVSLAGGAGGTWSPVIAASGAYDGNPDPTIFGQYLVGAVVADVWNEFAAYVSAPAGYTTAAVCFDSDFNGIRDAGDWTDSSSAGGWTWDLNVSDLSGDKTLRIWAQESGGAWSDPAVFTIDTLAAPDWMDPDLTTVEFLEAAQVYSIRSLIGERFGVYTPTDWPSWLAYRDGERTFNGIYFGTLVEADYSLAGRVVTSDINPAFGYQVFGIGPEFKFDFDSRSGSVTIDAYRLWQAYTDPLGCLTEAKKAPKKNDLYKFELNPPSATLAWTNDAALNNDLTFGGLQQTFSISLDARNLFEMTLPSFTAPIGATGLNVAVTPHFGFGPYFEAGWTTVLSGGQPVVSEASVEVGAEISFGAAAELQVLYGLVSGGLDVTASGQVGFQATRAPWGEWSYSIPVTLGIDIDLIGSLFWGAISGSWDLVSFSVTTDLWSSGGGSGGLQSAPGTLAALGDGEPELTLLSPAVAQSAGGEMAVGWVDIDPAGGAQPLYIQRRLATGEWQAAEIVASTNHIRGEPVLAYLPDGRPMALWSESTLDALSVPGMDGETVAAAQEVLWSVREETGWTTPAALTSDSLLDDQPALAFRSDGTGVAVWRHASGTDLDVPATSDLWYAEYDGTQWGSAMPMVDDASANGRPALAATPTGDVVAVWLSGSTMTGEDAVVKGAVLSGSSWSAPQTLSDAGLAACLAPRVVALPDGRVLAFWVEDGEDGQGMRMAIRTGGAWGTPTEVLPDQTLIGFPVVVAQGSQVSVVWHGVGNTSNVYAVSRDFANDHGWTTPRLLTPEEGHQWWALAGNQTDGQLDVAYISDTCHPSGALMNGVQANGGSFQYMTVQALADLSVEPDGVALEDSPPAAGVENIVHVTVTNVGVVPSEATDVRLYEGDPQSGGILFGTQGLTSLGVGESATLEFAWMPALGTSELWAVIDEAGTVTELDEANNAICALFTCVAAPTVALDPASDTGIPGDGWTTDTTPTVVGTTAEGTTVALYVDSQTTPVATGAATGGTYLITLPPLTNGEHTVWARARDAGGNPSPLSEPLVVRVEATSIPTPVAPELDAGSDTGTVGDGVTALLRPVLLGQAKALATVRILDGEALLGEVDASADGQYQFTPSEDMDEGVHVLTVVQADEVGNESNPSQPFDLTIDPTQVWMGDTDSHWEVADNWTPELVPGPHTPAVLDSPATHSPALHQDESIKGADFQTPNWTLGGSGHTLTVGSGGIDSAGAGINAVEPNVALVDDSTWTIGDENTLVLNGALSGGDHTLTKDGDGTLVLNGGQDHTTGLSLAIDGGTVRLGDAQTLVLDSLSIGSALDLTTGNLVVDYATPPTGDYSDEFLAVEAWVTSGFKDGPGAYWDGPGIQSSSAAASGDHSTTLAVFDNSGPGGGKTDLEGVPVDATSVLVKYTWYGDINLDGVVDFNDYNIIDNTFLSGATTDQHWQRGDLNYDGVVDFNDYNVMDNTWLAHQGETLGATQDPAAPVLTTAPMPDYTLPAALALPETPLLAASNLDGGAGEPATAEPLPALEASLDYSAQAPTPYTGGLLTVPEDDGGTSWQPWLPNYDGGTDGFGSGATQGLTDPLAVPALDVALGV